MALDPKQAASTRRILLRVLFLMGPLVLGAIAAPRVVAKFRKVLSADAKPANPPAPDQATPEQKAKAEEAAKALAKAERGWERVEVIAPSAPAAPGVEATAPFQGFGLSLESEPDGANVEVDGRALGETPLLAGLQCTPGATVRIRVTRSPHPVRELTTLCRSDTLVKLRVRLGAK